MPILAIAVIKAIFGMNRSSFNRNDRHKKPSAETPG